MTVFALAARFELVFIFEKNNEKNSFFNFKLFLKLDFKCIFDFSF